MTIVKQLRLLSAVLGVGTASAVIATAVFGDAPGSRPAPAVTRVDPSVPASDVAAKTRFTDAATLSYRLPSGETVFAWQVKPALAAQTARPRDVLVMVDTSASMAGEPLARARAVLTAFAKEAGTEDRLDIWTINFNDKSATRSLTDGFQSASSDSVVNAITKLADAEYGSGAVDLKSGLDQAAKQFGRNSSRNQVILYLGHGESAASREPLTESGRVDLGNMLADKDIAFFAVPFGANVNAQNLHGLATLTGGTVVRPTGTAAGKPRTEFVARLKEAFDAPILRADRVAFGPEGVEVYPTRLPPLRADRPTLVIGKLKSSAPRVAARIEGRVNGGKMTLDLSEGLAEPLTDNYFLGPMLSQWQAAPAKDAPAVLAADRTLSMAAEQFRLFRDEYSVQAVHAISVDRLDHAEKLFQAAAKIDPLCPEAEAGMRVLEKVRNGNLPTAEVKARLTTSEKIGIVLKDLSRKEAQQPAGGAKPAEQPPAGQTQAERDLIQQAKAAQAVIEQESRILVEETLRRARRLKLEAPDQAYEDLKRQRDSILANDQLSDPTRRKLAQDLETEMRDVQMKGAEITRRTAAERQRVAFARQKLNEFDRSLTEEEQTRNRIDQFRQLMMQWRFELAEAEAQTMIQERMSLGLRQLPETIASYRIGQSATNLREAKELRRIRQHNYLLTMMQVEKSFIPYPDEPPVHFPPAAVWRQLTGQRSEKYGFYSLGENAPPSFRRLRSVLEGEVDKRVQLKNLGGSDLQFMLNQLQQEFADYGVRFVFRTDLLGSDFKPTDIKLKTTGDLSGLPLGSFLDIVLRDLDPSLSWIARPEYIEIGPMMKLRYEEKVTKVFDVAELVIGIPQSVNTQTLYQNLAFIGAQATIFGAAFNPFAGAGFNAVGFAGGQFQGGFGGPGGGFGGPGGGFGGPGGGFGGPGAGGAQGGMGVQGGQGFAGAGQMGFQGGLAGQFGIQGNDQSKFLITLITSVVARGEWDLRQVGGANQQVFNQEDIDAVEKVVENYQLNSLGFYPPARALIIRGSSRYHPSSSFKLKKTDGGMGAGGPGLPGRGQFAGANPANGKPGDADPRALATAMAKKTGKDPAKLWNAAFGDVLTDPKLVLATCDILFEMNEYGHAAEALKANLRTGRATGNWAHEALAIALQAGQASPAEVERAALSAIDLDPTDPKAYLKAAKVENDLNHPEIALAFCQRAAALEPNTPSAYANALVYAEKSADVKSDTVSWASENLLRRDWAADGIDYHAQAKVRVESIAKKFAAAGRTDEAAKLQAVLAGEKNRDLVVELLWQGKNADLDLVVLEPTGSKCSATHKRTTGGGFLKADILGQDEDRSEVYTASHAFSGAYTLTAKRVLGTPIGRTATIKVTKFQGTPKQTVEMFSIDLADPKPIQIRVDGGSRTELASVPAEEVTEARLETTQEPVALAPSGFKGGTAAGSGRLSGAATSAIPTVVPVQEASVPSGVTGLPGMRVEAKLTPDRKGVMMTANPVFTGPAVELPLPKIDLLPGGNQ